MSSRVVRIGGASGSLRDSALAVPQLLEAGVDYLIFDFLAEGSMGLLAMLAQANPGGGYAPDFPEIHVRPNLVESLKRGTKWVANAGGVNPHGCAQVIAQIAAELGVNPRIAVVDGDDLRDQLASLRSQGITDMYTGAALPEAIDSINAYLGAFPIAEALAAGADIVITGRVVDSALTLGPLIHEFGWRADDHQRLAAGTLAGHLLECGGQVTGGTFTDWRDVPDWANVGYPIAECVDDGSFVITKPEGTGGLVSVGTMSEQLLYEIGDPQRYFVPDVTCDFSAVKLTPLAPNRVRVSGARGLPPTATYKVCTIHRDGWRASTIQPILGIAAAAKAERQAAALLKRTRLMLKQRGLADWRSTHVELLGTEACFGAHGRYRDSREVLCRMVVEHSERAAAELFAREQIMAIMSMSVGTTISQGTAVTPVQKLFSFLLDKCALNARLTIDGETREIPVPVEGGFRDADVPTAPAPAAIDLPADTQTVPLVALAWARSGDKGNLFNVGVIARRPEYLPYIHRALSLDAVSKWYAHTGDQGKPPRVTRYDAPGLSAINFVIHDALGGGITSSPRLDPVSKGMAQQLLSFPVSIPSDLARQIDPALRSLDDAKPYSASP